jgi:hypothetical protein
VSTFSYSIHSQSLRRGYKKPDVRRDSIYPLWTWCAAVDAFVVLVRLLDLEQLGAGNESVGVLVRMGGEMGWRTLLLVSGSTSHILLIVNVDCGFEDGVWILERCLAVYNRLGLEGPDVRNVAGHVPRALW